MKSLSLAELMLVCLAPQIDVDNCTQYVQAVCEIVNRSQHLVRSEKNLIEGFLEEVQMWHHTHDSMWLQCAVDRLHSYLDN